MFTDKRIAYNTAFRFRNVFGTFEKHGFVGVFRNGEGLGTGESYIPVVLFDLSCIDLPVSPMQTLPHPQGIL